MQFFRQPRRHGKPEDVEQEKAKRLFRAMGAPFWVAGTRRKKTDHHGTMQTPGLPDLPFVFLPRRAGHDLCERTLLVIEMKSPEAARKKNHGRSLEQIKFAHYCEQAGINYFCGTFDGLMRWLLSHGYLSAKSVPHYYLPCVDSTKPANSSTYAPRSRLLNLDADTRKLSERINESGVAERRRSYRETATLRDRR